MLTWVRADLSRGRTTPSYAPRHATRSRVLDPYATGRGVKPTTALAGVALAAVLGGGAYGGLQLLDSDGNDTVTGPATDPAAGPGLATQPDPAPCQDPGPASSVPDCPVSPASVGAVGSATYLPQGWALYAEQDHPFPTATAERVQSLERRYKGSGPGFLLVTVLYGDVQPWDPVDFDATLDREVRPGTDVLRPGLGEPPGTRFLWSAGPRVLVDVTFLGVDLSEEEKRRIVQGVQV